MKRMLTLKKRRSNKKKRLNPHRRFFKTIKKQQKKWIQMDSPYNSSQYLIENDSSPFEEDDFEDNFSPNPIILSKENIFYDEENSIECRKMSSFSTQGGSMIIEPRNKFSNELLF